MNKRVISADCLASVYSKIPHSLATSVEAPLPRNVPPLCISCQICNVYFKKISIPPPPLPRGEQRKFRGEGGSKFSRGGGVQISKGVGDGHLNRPLKFSGAPSKIDDQAISYFTIYWCCKAKIVVFIDDLLFAVHCTFFTACMIAYVVHDCRQVMNKLPLVIYLLLCYTIIVNYFSPTWIYLHSWKLEILTQLRE